MVGRCLFSTMYWICSLTPPFLKHDFVVLDHVKNTATIQNNKIEKTIDWAPSKDESRKHAIVVWVSLEDATILQSTGGYI